MSEPAVIPRPAELTAGSGHLRVNHRSAVLADAESHAAGELLAALLPPVAGVPRPVGHPRGAPGPDTIALAVDGSRSDLGSEGYELRVTSKRATLTGGDRRGVLCGVQTVRQLLAVDTGTVASLPAVTIRDRPRFAWRGLHLDVARHFFPVAFIERLLDLMALYKLNTLPLAPDRRPGLAHRDTIPAALDRGRLPARRHSSAPRPPPVGRHALRRPLHPGPGTAGGGVCRGARHHGGARDRDARSRAGGAGQLPGVGLPRRRLRGCHQLGDQERGAVRRAGVHVRLPRRGAERGAGAVSEPLHPRRRRRVPQTELARVPALPAASRQRGFARRGRAAELVHSPHRRVARRPAAGAWSGGTRSWREDWRRTRR